MVVNESMHVFTCLETFHASFKSPISANFVRAQLEQLNNLEFLRLWLFRSYNLFSTELESFKLILLKVSS